MLKKRVIYTLICVFLGSVFVLGTSGSITLLDYLKGRESAKMDFALVEAFNMNCMQMYTNSRPGYQLGWQQVFYEHGFTPQTEDPNKFCKH